jgi:hypothetical protein
MICEAVRRPWVGYTVERVTSPITSKNPDIGINESVALLLHSQESYRIGQDYPGFLRCAARGREPNK